MKSDSYEETPRGPLSQSQIKRNFFTQITRSQFDKLFTQQNFIGSGTQGQVYSAFHQGQKVAIKYFRRESLAPELINYIQGEIQALNNIRHQNILSLKGSYQVVISSNCKKFCIVTEYCESNLNNFEKIMSLSDFQKMKISMELIAGINAAHQCGVMHRDIKPQNILIKSLQKLQIKIADFGCSRINDEGMNVSLTKFIGTPLFSDPNIKGGRYSVKCDIYSAGLVIINTFCGKHFFSHCSSVQQLAIAKKNFTKDIVVSAMTFMEEFESSEVSDQMKSFLVDIATLTMQDEDNDRYSARQLLKYIKQMLKNFEDYEPENQIVEKNSAKGHMQKQGSGDMSKKKKMLSEFIETQETQESPQKINLKKQSTLQQNYDHSYIETPNEDQHKSQSDIQTAECSGRISIEKLKGKYSTSKNDISFQEKSNNSFEIYDQNYKNKSFDSLENQSQNMVESPTKSQQYNQNNSFISSDSNEFQRKWNQKQKAQGNSIKMSRSIKSSSEIIESRITDIKSPKSIEDQSIRLKKIEKKQKTLNETQKLCAELIRIRGESSTINEEGEAMKNILGAFNSIKGHFSTVKRIENIRQAPLSKEQKEIIVFFFYFLYTGKMKDLRLFVLGHPSNLKIEYIKISSKRREMICNIVDKELMRVFDNLKDYSNDLKRKIDLIKPRLSDLTRNWIDDAFRCNTTADLLTKTYKEAQIKQECRNFIEEKLAITKNEQEIEILKDLSKAIGRMCQ